jgi:glutaredoxin
MEEIILFTTGCPKCRVLEAKLKQKGIKYEEVTDMNVMTERRFLTVPVLEVNGTTMNFTQAVEWANNN